MSTAIIVLKVLGVIVAGLAAVIAIAALLIFAVKRGRKTIRNWNKDETEDGAKHDADEPAKKEGSPKSNGLVLGLLIVVIFLLFDLCVAEAIIGWRWNSKINVIKRDAKNTLGLVVQLGDTSKDIAAKVAKPVTMAVKPEAPKPDPCINLCKIVLDLDKGDKVILDSTRELLVYDGKCLGSSELCAKCVPSNLVGNPNAEPECRHNPAAQ